MPKQLPERAKLEVSVDLALNLVKSRARFFFPGTSLPEARELLFILGFILRTQLKGGLPTISQLARTTEYPRTTLMRRLEALQQTGWVHKHGRNYHVDLTRLMDTRFAAFLKSNINLISKASKKLSDLDDRT
jgi:DNA-binding IclR family transcriptional regulator